MKTTKLNGAALDWAVAMCEGVTNGNALDVGFIREGGYTPSTNWAQGGAIIEREAITILSTESGEWCAAIGELYYEDNEPRSPTPLIAAMRCYVANKLGDEVQIPEALINENAY